MCVRIVFVYSCERFKTPVVENTRLDGYRFGLLSMTFKKVRWIFIKGSKIVLLAPPHPIIPYCIIDCAKAE